MKSANADEIFGFASDEIKSTHPPSRRISSNEVGFHRRRRFHPPARVDLVENDRFLSESVIFWWRRRGSNSRPYGCEPYALPTELRPLNNQQIVLYIIQVNYASNFLNIIFQIISVVLNIMGYKGENLHTDTAQ